MLTQEQFQDMTTSPCFYCQRQPYQKSRSYTYNGIDRKDHTQGYTPDNCVPCGGECNFIKGKILTPDEMLIVAEALWAFRKQNGVTKNVTPLPR